MTHSDQPPRGEEPIAAVPDPAATDAAARLLDADVLPDALLADLEESYACEVCGEGDGDLDDEVVANHVDSQGTPHLAHVDCAPDGWRLA